ncbi:MAG: GNAT family N-acetyltransferase [Bacteroidales bacterium]|nr:GNAT family N-acetyltransferase [Bacteroidales bacterium]
MEELELHVKRFYDLTLDELYGLLRVRSEVFIVEQNCVYQDVDGDDKIAIHAWLTRGEKIVAMLRVLPSGSHNLDGVSIGRVITTERGKGYGETIVRHGLRLAVEVFGASRVVIQSQEQAKGFYEKVGFRATSEPYMFEGLPHRDMVWEGE